MPPNNQKSNAAVQWCVTAFLIVASLNIARAQFGSAQQIYNFGGLGLPQLIQVADLDGDSDNDIIIKGDGSAEPIRWLANDGAGNFNTPSTQLSTGQNNLAQMVSLQAFDYDKDGDIDIVGAFRFSQKIHLWNNLGSGTFSNPVVLASSFYEMHSLLIYDMDLDGDQDIAVAREYDDALWLENDLEHHKWNQKTLTIGDADYLDAADVDGDGILDIFSMLDNTSYGIYKNGKSIALKKMSPATYLKLVDIDSDGDLDVISAVENYNNGISWLENIDDIYTHRTIEGSAGLQYQAVTIFDYDDDGDQDIVAGCFVFCGVDLYENTGGGKFKLTKTIGSGGLEEQSLLSADLNGDGRKDIIRSNSGTHTVVWQPNTTTPFTGIEASFLYEGKCLHDAILFRNTVRGKNVIGYRWNFGDGSAVSLEKNPTHTFTKPGTYTVSLKATNAQGQTSSYQTDVNIQATTALEDLKYQFCSKDYTATFDPSYQYKWYGGLEDTNPFSTQNSLNMSFSYTYYIARVGPSGCLSDRSKVAFEKHDYPSTPVVTGSAVFNGGGTMELTALGKPDEKIYWATSPKGDPFFTGTRYASQFNETTTYYVRAMNSAGCSGSSVPVVASVYTHPITEPVFTWADATQSTGTTESIDMQKDADDNLLVYGWYGKSIAKAGDFTADGTNTYSNRFLIRYDQAGSVLQLTKIIANAEPNYQYESIMVDKDNNTYISFKFYGSFTFDNVTVTSPTTDRSYTFIGKVNESGAYLWHQIIDSDYAAFALKSNDNIIGVANQPFSIMTIFELSKVSGNSVWKTQRGALDDIEDLVVDQSGNIYLSGTTYDFFESVTKVPEEFTTLAIAKYAPDGTYQWSKRFVENVAIANRSHLSVDTKGNLLVGGHYGIGFFKDPSETVTILGIPVGGGGSLALAKLNPEGSTLWVKRINFDGGGDFADLATDLDDNIFIAGQGSGAGHFDWFTDYNHSTFVAKYDGSGSFQWVRGINPHTFYALRKVVPDNVGNAAIFGDFVDQLTLDNIFLSSATHGSSVNENVFTAKLGYTLKADFKYDAPCVGQTIQFTDWSTPADGTTLVNWDWSFGDGGHSTEQNPKHTFSSNGDYTVTLKVTDNVGGNKTKSSVVKTLALTNPVQVDILSSNSSVCQGDEVKYTAKLSNISTSYTLQWYVDNIIQPNESGHVEFISIADKQKEIKVEVNAYSDQCKINPIGTTSVSLVVNPIPQTPVVSASDTQLCYGNSITLKTEGTYQTYKWSNGMQTEQLDVTESGIYSLQVGLLNACFSKPSQPVAINFIPNDKALITVDGDSLRASAGSTYIWFKDNAELIYHTRAIKREPGSYTVEIFNAYDCSNVSSPLTIYAPIKSEFSSNKQMIDVGESVNYTSLATGSPEVFEWVFEGGTPAVSTDVNPVGIVYKNSGMYAVSLKVSGNIQTDVKTITQYITVQNMQADFTVSKNEVIVNELITFTDQSLGNPDTYEWQLAGALPSTADAKNPSVSYSNPGDYSVSLTVKREEYANTVVKNEFIKVYPLLIANFNMSENNIVAGESIDFTSAVAGNPEIYEWTFDGGVPSTSQEINPIGIVFPDAGTFKVKLVVSDKLQTSEKTAFATVKTITGIEVKNSAFSIYPNPTNGDIEIKNLIAPFMVKIYDSVGSLVQTVSKINGNLLRLNLSTGIYLIKIVHEDEVYYRKIIVN